jgi:hypothetical protein
MFKTAECGGSALECHHMWGHWRIESKQMHGKGLQYGAEASDVWTGKMVAPGDHGRSATDAGSEYYERVGQCVDQSSHESQQLGPKGFQVVFMEVAVG